jgi:hypothetical protein
MAAVLSSSIELPPNADWASVQHAIDQHRRELRRDPGLWAIELTRLTVYIIWRLFALPWLLIWPAVVLWLMWYLGGYDLTHVGHLLQEPLESRWLWTYVTGAAFQTLNTLGANPYESEFERRLLVFEQQAYARLSCRPAPVAGH